MAGDAGDQAVHHRRAGLAVGRRGFRRSVRAAAGRCVRRDLRDDRGGAVGLAAAAGHRRGRLRRQHRADAVQRFHQRDLAVGRRVLLRQRAAGACRCRARRPPPAGQRAAAVVPDRVLPAEHHAHAGPARRLPGHQATRTRRGRDPGASVRRGDVSGRRAQPVRADRLPVGRADRAQRHDHRRRAMDALAARPGLVHRRAADRPGRRHHRRRTRVRRHHPNLAARRHRRARPADAGAADGRGAPRRRGARLPGDRARAAGLRRRTGRPAGRPGGRRPAPRDRRCRATAAPRPGPICSAAAWSCAGRPSAPGGVTGEFTAVPYCLWSNRGAGPMRVWIPLAEATEALV